MIFIFFHFSYKSFGLLLLLKMDLEPIRKYRSASLGSYNTSKQGLQTYYQCPKCPMNSVTKKCVSQHIITKHQEKDDNEQLKRTVNILNSKMLENVSQISAQQNQLNETKVKCQALQIQVIKLRQKVSIFESKTHQDISGVTQQIMQESTTFLSIIKMSIYDQIGILIKQGFKIYEIINKTKQIIIQHLQNINILPYFSRFKQIFVQFEKYIEQKYKKHSTKYRQRIRKSVSFLKGYSEKQFQHIQRMVMNIITQPISLRHSIKLIFNLFSERYSDYFKFPTLPTRIFDDKTKKNEHRPKLVLSNVIQFMNHLKEQSQFILMVDIWFCVCLGFRSRQLRRIYLEDEDGNIANYVRVWQTKNEIYTNRVIPTSLRAMISKHGIKYPMSQLRWKRVVRVCLDKLKSFYGLRSLCITEIVSGVLKSANINFHQDFKTTMSFYINTEHKQIIDKVFSFQNYFLPQSTKYFVFHADTVEYLSILSVTKISQKIEQDEEILDAILRDQNIIQTENPTQQQKIENKALKFGFDLSKETFKDINQIFSVDKEMSIDQISKQLEISVQIYSIQSDKQVSLISKSIANEQQPINIIEENISTGKIYRIDQSSCSVKQVLRKRKKVTNYALPQNWPLLKKSIKCLRCFGQLQESLCSQGDHYINKCVSCGFDKHQCQLIKGNVTESQKIFCQKYIESLQKLDCIRTLNKKNNIKDIIEKQNRIFIQHIESFPSTPAFITNMPKFTEHMKKMIEYVRQNEQFLPLRIKKTSNRGYGVYTTARIPRGSIICLYNGILARNQAINLNDDSRIQIGMVKKDDSVVSIFLDASTYCNVGRFINSSSSANSHKKNAQITMGLCENLSKCQIVLLLYSSRDIEAQQQILWWYGMNYWKTLGIQPLEQKESEIIQQEDALQNRQVQDQIHFNQDRISEQEEQIKFLAATSKKVKRTIQQVDQLGNINDDKNQNDSMMKLYIKSLQTWKKPGEQGKMEQKEQKLQIKQEQKLKEIREQRQEQQREQKQKCQNMNLKNCFEAIQQNLENAQQQIELIYPQQKQLPIFSQACQLEPFQYNIQSLINRANECYANSFTQLLQPIIQPILECKQRCEALLRQISNNHKGLQQDPIQVFIKMHIPEVKNLLNYYSILSLTCQKCKSIKQVHTKQAILQIKVQKNIQTSITRSKQNRQEDSQCEKCGKAKHKIKQQYFFQQYLLIQLTTAGIHRIQITFKTINDLKYKNYKPIAYLTHYGQNIQHCHNTCTIINNKKLYQINDYQIYLQNQIKPSVILLKEVYDEVGCFLVESQETNQFILMNHFSKSVNVASIVKLMLINLVLKHKISGSYQYTKQIHFFHTQTQSSAGLKEGSYYTIEYLLEALGTCSGCDSARLVKKVIELTLNQKVQIVLKRECEQLGISASIIGDCIGLENNHSNAMDVVKIFKQTMINNCWQKYFTSSKFESTNQLIKSNLIGKTGSAPYSYNFVGYKQGLIICVLGTISKSSLWALVQKIEARSNEILKRRNK